MQINILIALLSNPFLLAALMAYYVVHRHKYFSFKYQGMDQIITCIQQACRPHGRSVNPVSTGREDYVHHIITGTPHIFRPSYGPTLHQNSWLKSKIPFSKK